MQSTPKEVAQRRFRARVLSLNKAASLQSLLWTASIWGIDIVSLYNTTNTPNCQPLSQIRRQAAAQSTSLSKAMFPESLLTDHFTLTWTQLSLVKLAKNSKQQPILPTFWPFLYCLHKHTACLPRCNLTKCLTTHNRGHHLSSTQFYVFTDHPLPKLMPYHSGSELNSVLERLSCKSQITHNNCLKT